MKCHDWQPNSRRLYETQQSIPELHFLVATDATSFIYALCEESLCQRHLNTRNMVAVKPFQTAPVTLQTTSDSTSTNMNSSLSAKNSI